MIYCGQFFSSFDCANVSAIVHVFQGSLDRLVQQELWAPGRVVAVTIARIIPQLPRGTRDESLKRYIFADCDFLQSFFFLCCCDESSPKFLKILFLSLAYQG